MSKVEEQFKEFLDNTDNLDKTENTVIAGPQILLEMFYYRPEDKKSPIIAVGSLSDYHAGKKLGEQYFPIGRVLQVGLDVKDPYSNLKRGDIVNFADSLFIMSDNPAYREWEREAENSRPRPVSESPPQKIQEFEFGFKRFQYQTDKFKKEDKHLFLLPSTSIVSWQTTVK